MSHSTDFCSHLSRVSVLDSANMTCQLWRDAKRAICRPPRLGPEWPRRTLCMVCHSRIEATVLLHIENDSHSPLLLPRHRRSIICASSVNNSVRYVILVKAEAAILHSTTLRTLIATSRLPVGVHSRTRSPGSYLSTRDVELQYRTVPVCGVLILRSSVG